MSRLLNKQKTPNFISSFLIPLHREAPAPGAQWGRIHVEGRGRRRRKTQGAQGPFPAAQAARERMTAETDGPQQLGPALTQTAFISNLLLPSVNLLAKVHLYISFPSNLIYHLLYAYMLWGILGDSTGGGALTRNQSTQLWTTLNLNTGGFIALAWAKEHQLILPPHLPPVKKILNRQNMTYRWICR